MKDWQGCLVKMHGRALIASDVSEVCTKSDGGFAHEGLMFRAEVMHTYWGSFSTRIWVGCIRKVSTLSSMSEIV